MITGTSITPTTAVVAADPEDDGTPRVDATAAVPHVDVEAIDFMTWTDEPEGGAERTDGLDTSIGSADFVVPEPDDGTISGIVFDDLVGAPDDAIVEALVMTALAGATAKYREINPRRGAYLLREAARHLLAYPREHFLMDGPDDEVDGSAL